MSPGVLGLLCGTGIVLLFAYAGIRAGPQFVVRRLAGLVFVLVGVTFITFILGYVTPGTPVENLCGDKCTAHELFLLNHLYGLDLPWWQQYARFLNNLLHLDLGLSFTQRGKPVLDVMGRGVPISTELGLEATVLQVAVGVPLGIWAAVKAGSLFDTVISTISLFLLALPSFVVIPFFQIAMVQLSAHSLPHLPLAGWDAPIDRVAPVLILALTGMGFFVRLMRTTMLDVLGQDYIRTARAKGLPEPLVVRRHAFRNATIPLLTALGPAVAFVVGGAYFVEYFFNIPGIGFWTVASVSNKDMPVVQGTTILVAVAVAVMNLLVDVLYGVLDPRIKIT